MRFGDAQIAATCDLSREGIAAALEKTLSDAGVPAIPVDQAKPPAFDVARIDLVPEVFSFNDGGLDCTSWVDLSAESHENLHIAPVGAPRAVTVDYWRQGLLLESGETQHEQAVEGAFQKLATRFAESYRRAQPPKLPGQ